VAWLDRTQYLSARLAQLRIGRYKLPSGFAHWLARTELGEFGSGVCIPKPASAVSLVGIVLQDLKERLRAGRP
jgi:hypothetical protein